jgi:hypothetical protein
MTLRFPRSDRLLLLAVLLLQAASARAQVPVGGARLDIESDAVTSALQQRRAALEPRISAYVAEKAKANFAFLNWRPDESGTPAGFELIVQLFEEPSGSCPPTTYVRLVGTLGGVQQPTHQLELYDGCNPNPPYQYPDTTRFEADLRGKIDRLFSEDVRRQIQQNLLAKVVLADKLTIDHSRKRVIVPLHLKDLKASEDSQLTIRFQTGGVQGRLRAKPWGEQAEGIQCQFTDFEVPPPVDVSVVGGHFFWHQGFERVFPPGNLPPLGVFMTDYKLDPFVGLGVSDGMVTTGP